MLLETAERAELIDDNESKPEIACFLQCGAILRLLLRNLPINQRLVVITVQGDNMVQRFPNIYAAKHFEWSNIDFVQRQLLPKKGDEAAARQPSTTFQRANSSNLMSDERTPPGTAA